MTDTRDLVRPVSALISDAKENAELNAAHNYFRIRQLLLDMAAALESAERDARRYRWLAKRCYRYESPDGMGYHRHGIHWESFGAESKHPTLDAALDAALAPGDERGEG